MTSYNNLTGPYTAYPSWWIEPTHRLKKKFLLESTNPSYLFRKGSYVRIKDNDAEIVNRKTNRLKEIVDGHSSFLCTISLSNFSGNFNDWFEKI